MEDVEVPEENMLPNVKGFKVVLKKKIILGKLPMWGLERKLASTSKALDRYTVVAACTLS